MSRTTLGRVLAVVVSADESVTETMAQQQNNGMTFIWMAVSLVGSARMPAEFLAVRGSGPTAPQKDCLRVDPRVGRTTGYNEGAEQGRASI